MVNRIDDDYINKILLSFTWTMLCQYDAVNRLYLAQFFSGSSHSRTVVLAHIWYLKILMICGIGIQKIISIYSCYSIIVIQTQRIFSEIKTEVYI